MVQAVLSGELADVELTPDPFFKVLVPSRCADVPPALLQPRLAWRNAADYDANARRLAELFRKNFERYAGQVSEEVRRAGP